MLTEEQIKKLSDRELQEEEHDTQVDFFNDLTASSFLISIFMSGFLCVHPESIIAAAIKYFFIVFYFR